MRNKLASLLVFVFVLVGSAVAQTGGDSGCKSVSGHQLSHDMRWMGKGIVLAPKHAIKPSNLKWEIPVVAATAFMVNVGDNPTSRTINDTHEEQVSNRFGDVGLYSEWGLAGALFAAGCATHRDSIRSAGLQALEAGGTAMALDGMVKVLSNRVRPNANKSNGNFWDAGGRSFASGHAAASFAIASVLAKHTRSKWKKFALYGAAGAIAFSRFPAKQHFLSDIIVGSTLGYVVGTYMTDSPPMHLSSAP